ncbi:baseplate J/gp47 family protein [Streptomyces sp. NPDC051555]|uniref:baseplate J/gp47 family protein n=1 Tax=Streptomyces sp. NPDC051555 TaxID=3365657 RepID=UPI0037A2ABDD
MTSPSPPRLAAGTREAALELAKQACDSNHLQLPSDPLSPVNLLLNACAGMAAQASGVVNLMPDYMKYLVLKKMGAFRPRQATAARTTVDFTMKAGRTTHTLVPAGFVVRTTDQPPKSFTVINETLIPVKNKNNSPVVVWPVPVIHARRVENEFLGTVDGTPDQAFTLGNTPLSGPVPLEWSADGRKWADCTQVEDFTARTRTGPYYRLDTATNTIVLPPAPSFPAGTLLRIPSYLTDGGFSGNVAAHTLTVMPQSLPGITSVTNRSKASGGRDAETVAEAVSRLTLTDVIPPRAVTPYEYEKLALQANTGLASARWVPNSSADKKATLWTPGTPVTATFTCGPLPSGPIPPPLPAVGTTIAPRGEETATWIVESATSQSISVQLQQRNKEGKTDDSRPVTITFRFPFPASKMQTGETFKIRMRFKTPGAMEPDSPILEEAGKIKRVDDPGSETTVTVTDSQRNMNTGSALLTIPNATECKKGEMYEVTLTVAKKNSEYIRTNFIPTAIAQFSHTDIDAVRGVQADEQEVTVDKDSKVSLKPPATGSSLPVVRAGGVLFREIPSFASVDETEDPAEPYFIVDADASHLTVSGKWIDRTLTVGPYQSYSNSTENPPTGQWQSSDGKTNFSVAYTSPPAPGTLGKAAESSGSHVTLRVVPVCIPDAEGFFSKEQLSCSPAVKFALAEFLRPYQIPGVRLVLLPPVLKEVMVRAELEADPHLGADEDDRIISAAKKSINENLNPNTGVKGVPGWPPETPVRQSDLYRILESIPGVRRVRNVTLGVPVSEGGSWMGVSQIDLAAGELPLTVRGGMHIEVVRTASA